MATHHVIGIDGGGTKTAGAIATTEGALLAQDRLGASNPHASSAPDVEATLRGLIDGLPRKAGVDPASVSAICLSLAGVDRPKDRQLIESLIAPSLRPGQRVAIVNDSIAGIMAALDEPHGLMLISGTGSVCFGYHRDGRTSRCGGWGQIIGDEGSGYAMGVAALKAIIQAFDGRGPATELTARILAALALGQPTDVISWLMSVNNSKAEIAALSRHVHEADASGDPTASAILDRMADDLVAIIPPAHERLFGASSDQAVPIVFGGSNIIKGERYQRRVRDRIARTGLALEPVLPTREPVEGAARYAALMASGRVTAGTVV